MNTVDRLPHYCPSCKVGVISSRGLCDSCGDALILQGYCPICETFWNQPVDSLCPKHEVELLDQTESEAETDAAPLIDGSRLVLMKAFESVGEAHAARIRLEAEGIPTFLDSERMASKYSLATGGVKLSVPESLSDQARVLLSQSWTPPKSDDLDEAWEDLEPEPWEARRRIMKALIVVTLFGPLVATGVSILIKMLNGN